MGENTCDRELVLLALRRLAFVWGERSDADQSCYALIGSRGGNEGSALGVADEDGRATDSRECVPDYSDVAFGRVEAVLAGQHLIALRLKREDQLAKARAVGPNPVGEHNARFV